MSSNSAKIPTLTHMMGAHIVTGAFAGLLAIVATWVVTWFVDVHVEFGMLVVALALTRFLSDVLSAATTHLITLRHGLHAERTFAYHALVFLAWTFLALVVSSAITKSLPATLLLTAVVAVVNAAFLLWMRPWQPGMSSEEFAEKWEELKVMTREHFAEVIEHFKSQGCEKAKQKHYAKLARREARRK